MSAGIVGEGGMPGVSHGKVILAGFIGSPLERYDSAVYGFFAPVIANNSLPAPIRSPR